MNGIRQYLSDQYYKLMNTPGQINDVAAGFAIGVFVSFSPLWGLHTALTILFAYLLRRSVGAGVIGTLIFNPFTAPVIIAANLKMGRLITGIHAGRRHILLSGDIEGIHALWKEGAHLFYPFLVGGLVLGAVAAVLSFFIVRRSLATYRHRIYLRKHKHDENRENPQ